jgi:probable rRNA maturation factor
VIEPLAATGTAAVEILAPCADWARACAAAEDLVRAAARLAVARGTAGCGIPRQAAIELAVSLADDAVQRQLNRVWRGVDRPTNVLAFPAWEPDMPVPPDAPLLLGDVVLAFETVAREADEQGKPLADHLAHLVVHGVLHLLGHDHCAEAEAVAMESLETSILASLGVPDPYRGTM